MTGNIIVSTCCLGDMAVNAPESEGAARGLGGGGGGAFTAILPSQTCANYYLSHTSANFTSISSSTREGTCMLGEGDIGNWSPCSLIQILPCNINNFRFHPVRMVGYFGSHLKVWFQHNS